MHAIAALRLAGALVLGATAGCSSLLPRSEAKTESPWQSYQEAQQAFDKIIPGRTTTGELAPLKLDPKSNPNITILNYSDVLKRFLANPSLTVADLDSGVKECISAKIYCTGFEITQRTVNKHRNGNFIADFLGFRREVHISGWNFTGLVLMKDGVVIYKLTGGQPSIMEYEHNHNPLGPVNSILAKMFGWF